MPKKGKYLDFKIFSGSFRNKKPRNPKGKKNICRPKKKNNVAKFFQKNHCFTKNLGFCLILNPLIHKSSGKIFLMGVGMEKFAETYLMPSNISF